MARKSNKKKVSSKKRKKERKARKTRKEPKKRAKRKRSKSTESDSSSSSAEIGKSDEQLNGMPIKQRLGGIHMGIVKIEIIIVDV